MNKQPKPRRCAICKEEFIPKRIIGALRLTKTCGNAGCELDSAQGHTKKDKPKKKTVTTAKLKKELWQVFSLHQKLVHSSDGEWCQCYTCNKPIKIGTSDCQGGHCLSKAANGNLYFDERAVRPQCHRCNGYYGGMSYEFNERLKQEIGLEDWQDMYDNRKMIVKRSASWYVEKIEYYSDEVKRLKNVKFCK